MEELERARRYGTGMAVIMAHIDQFKRLKMSSVTCWETRLRQVSSSSTSNAQD